MKVNKPAFHKRILPHLSVVETPLISYLGLLVFWEQGENMAGNFTIQFPDFYLHPCFQHQPHTLSSFLFSYIIPVQLPMHYNYGFLPELG